jgi:osmotically inducible protein OsmC
VAQQKIDIKRIATAKWTGDVPGGSGRVASGSGAIDAAYSFNTRFGGEPGTNPEELLAAAHAGCFTMALAFALTQAAHPPKTVDTSATVHLTRNADGFSIPAIDLVTTAVVPGLDDATFQTIAEGAKKNCPLSKALASVPIALTATLEQGAPAA